MSGTEASGVALLSKGHMLLPAALQHVLSSPGPAAVSSERGAKEGDVGADRVGR